MGPSTRPRFLEGLKKKAGGESSKNKKKKAPRQKLDKMVREVPAIREGCARGIHKSATIVRAGKTREGGKESEEEETRNIFFAVSQGETDCGAS